MLSVVKYQKYSIASKMSLFVKCSKFHQNSLKLFLLSFERNAPFNNILLHKKGQTMFLSHYAEEHLRD